MTTSSRTRVRRHEEARKSRGERAIKVWVPISDPRAAERVRDLANRLCKAAQAQTKPNANTEREERTP